MTPLLGTDISIHNRRLGLPVKTAKLLRKKGVRFVIIRASIGTLIDTAAQRSVKVARDNGFVVGLYHFLDDGPPGDAQAETFFRQVERAGGPHGLLLVNDVESTRDNRPTWNDAKLWARRMGVLAGPDQPLGFYTNRSTAVNLHNPDAASLYDWLWQALYTDREDLDTPGISLPPQPPRAGFLGFREAAMWQYGPMAFTPPSGGQQNKWDGNAWYGTIEELKALTKPRFVPLPQRPNYALGYNRAIAQSVAAIGLLELPDTVPSGPAFPAGWSEGRDDARRAADELRMT
jgi:GH25 family lysozyme M1 (1,4-beta-N-acetylmuramidase)